MSVGLFLQRIGLRTTFLTVLCLQSFVGVQAVERQQLELAIGQTRVVSLGEIIDGRWQVEVSRAGVIEVDWHKEQQLAITGLKKGFVLIKVIDYADEVQTVISVRVEARERLKKQQFDRQQWLRLCRNTGLSCRAEQGEIWGQVESIEQWARILTFCGKRRGKQSCAHEYLVERAAVERPLVASELFAGLEVVAIGERSFLIKGPCDGQQQKTAKARRGLLRQLYGEVFEQGHVRWLCSDELSFGEQAAPKRLKVYIFLEHWAEQELKGLRLQSQAVWQPGAAFDRLALGLEAQKGRQQSELLASPEAFVQLGQKVTLKAGGELLTGYRASSGTRSDDEGQLETVDQRLAGIWKSYGVHVEMTLEKTRAGGFLTEYVATLRFPKGQGSQSGGGVRLSLDQLQGTQVLFPGQKSLLGTTLLTQSARRKRTIPWLEHLPIFGPLFQSRGVEKSTSRLWVFGELFVEEAS